MPVLKQMLDWKGWKKDHIIALLRIYPVCLIVYGFLLDCSLGKYICLRMEMCSHIKKSLLSKKYLGKTQFFLS